MRLAPMGLVRDSISSSAFSIAATMKQGCATTNRYWKVSTGSSL